MGRLRNFLWYYPWGHEFWVLALLYTSVCLKVSAMDNLTFYNYFNQCSQVNIYKLAFWQTVAQKYPHLQVRSSKHILLVILQINFWLIFRLLSQCAPPPPRWPHYGPEQAAVLFNRVNKSIFSAN